MELTYKKRLKLLLFFVSSFAFSASFAQTIRGSVRDITGLNLAGASVTIQGSSKGAIADNDGNYSLAVAPGKYVLLASFVGYATQRAEVTVNEKGAEHDFVLGNSGDLGTVTVVGSRSAARTRTETPVPVDIIPLAQVINTIGQVDL